jgi:ribosome-binding factor A
VARVRRTDRLNEQLRQEVSLLLRGEVRDPRVGLVTITAVEASPELDHAKIYFTLLGDEAEKEAALAGLRSASSFLRRELGKRLHMRRIPELHFEIDRVLEQAGRIEELLRQVRTDPEMPEDAGGDEREAEEGAADEDGS